MTKYKAINDYVIVVRDYKEKVTASGIIVTNPNYEQVMEFTVVATTETTKDLQDLVVLAPRHKVLQLNESEAEVYGSLNYKDIIAVK